VDFFFGIFFLKNRRLENSSVGQKNKTASITLLPFFCQASAEGGNAPPHCDTWNAAKNRLRLKEATLRRIATRGTRQKWNHPAFGHLRSRRRFPRFSRFSGETGR
jgi:hypothetical protein